MSDWKDKVFAQTCSSLGLGYAPVASGTIGCLPAVAIYMIIAAFAPPRYVTPLLLLMLALSSALTILLGSWAENYWKTKDPKYFVLDEYAGYFLTVALFRLDGIMITAIWTFIFSRFFDILKPPPAGRIEYFPAGWGILLDDLIASVYAAGVLHVLLLYFPTLFTRG